MMETTQHFADALVRIAVGAFMLPHGISKIRALLGLADSSGEERAFASLGLQPPRVWVWAVGLMQSIGGLLLVVGLYSRFSAIALAITLLGSIVFTARKGWFWHRGGMEYSLFWLLLTIAVVVRGDGALSLAALWSR